MLTRNRLAAVAVAAFAFAGAGASTAFADTGSTATGNTAKPATAQSDQVVSFFDQAADGMLDAYCSGPQGPVTWPTIPSDACQQWRVYPGTSGSLIESVAKSGWCITAPEEIGQAPTNQPCNVADPAQQWDFPSIGGNKVYIAETDDNQRVLGSLGNYAALELQQASASEWQKWVPAPPA